MRFLKKIVIVGNPNVGKSLIFNKLTGTYVTVSNYPGTTVEVSKARALIGGVEFEVVDTPGAYSLKVISEEERVARAYMLNEKIRVLLHVIDAKNIQRMLPFTIQMIEADLPLILVLNMMDEARKIGMKIDIKKLETNLGIPVVETVSVTGEGIDILKGKIEEYAREEN